jgi:CheY-like chemotaxis protein
VANLLNNAVKYTPAGGAIQVTIERGAGEAVLRVRDSGPGIPADHLGSIFELFTQVHPDVVASGDGLGIGLALVKRLVELHGGTVEAASEGDDRGACFTVTLPLASLAAASPASTAGSAGSGGRALRVVVVEDDADARELFRLGLRLAGHQVEVAGDAATGVEQACATHPDVVIVDIGSDVERHEVARRIRAKLGPAPFLIALTGFAGPDDRRRASEAGFDAHVTKPATVEDLLRRVTAQRGSP